MTEPILPLKFIIKLVGNTKNQLTFNDLSIICWHFGKVELKSIIYEENYVLVECVCDEKYTLKLWMEDWVMESLSELLETKYKVSTIVLSF